MHLSLVCEFHVILPFVPRRWRSKILATSPYFNFWLGIRQRVRPTPYLCINRDTLLLMRDLLRRFFASDDGGFHIDELAVAVYPSLPWLRDATLTPVGFVISEPRSFTRSVRQAGNAIPTSAIFSN